MKRAIFPGSFDPFTIGHYSIVMRGLEIFDEIVIGIGINQTKRNLFSVEERQSMIEQAFVSEPRVKIQPYNCLTIDFAQQVGADFVLRGLRTVADFEYERSIADANRKLSGIETVILFTEDKYAFISSTVVRDLVSFGKDIRQFLPPGVTVPYIKQS
ncbi:MAG: pantetheine-phosphate adenylyltransferase [Bacteroidetes bacterium]|uniref:Phosphopantetheine adenylyltransferase n=1 Tax=Candidatus Gallipaludibacter merdavium TaxID=2840839 RepID=A0A9D9HRZ1_9BACT|nr:pantetheine-phosphate adenylyltransferase [Candidatus Gallipaludibacter merdavium]